MASMKVDVSKIKALATRADDPSLKKELNDIANSKGAQAIVAQAIADNFAVGGPGWPPLKIRKGQILKKTGVLMKSVTTPGAPGNISRVTGNVLTWGTNLSYANIHNEGGTIKAKNAKALFIPLTARAEKEGPKKGGSKLKVGVDVIFRKSVTIPKREFLVLRPYWQQQLQEFMYDRVIEILAKYLIKKGHA